MKRTFWLMVMGLGLGLGLGMSMLWAAQDVAQIGNAQDHGDMLRKAEQAMVLVLVGDGGGRVLTVPCGVIIRSDGIVLTAYHPLKGAQEVQVRLRNGEVYDQANLIGFDERRDVAALSLSASGLDCLTTAALEDAGTGEKIQVLTADGAMAWSAADGVLGPVRLADEVLGAGHGYRVIEFMALIPQGALGGALINTRGQLLGIIPASLKAGGQQFAIPAGSVMGLPAQGLHTALGSGKNLAPSAFIPNSAPAPGEQTDPAVMLANARTLRVTSKTTFFTPFMLNKELLNNTDFRNLGISVLEGYKGGELLVNVDRPVFTYDFTYSVSEGHSGIVLATGKVTAIDGPHAAQGIAKKLVQELEKARAVVPPQATRPEALNVQP